MSYKLILVPESVLVEDPKSVDDHGVVQGAAPGETVLFQVFDFVQKAESSGFGQFTFKGHVGKAEKKILVS